MLTSDSGAFSDADLDALDPLPSTPWFRASLVMSVDGVIAVDGDSSALSGPADRMVYRHLREQSDAIVVGATTGQHPAYARLSSTLVIVSTSGSIQTHAERPIIITTTEGARLAREQLPAATVIDAGEQRVDLRLAHARLVERGFQRILCEGGPTLLHGLLEDGLIDEICLTLSPQLVGSGPGLLPGAFRAPLALTRAAEHEGMLFLRYRVLPLEAEGGRMSP